MAGRGLTLDNTGNLVIYNGTVMRSEDFAFPDTYAYNVVYEVVRVIDGVPLFVEEHYQRLRRSLKIIGMEPKISEEGMKTEIKRLAGMNQKPACNVRICFYCESGAQDILFYIRKSRYPSRDDVEKGVRTGLIKWERKLPNLKLEDLDYKDAVERKMREGGYYEVLLANRDNKITEGSKTNVFFVKGSKVFTAPDEYVLKGVTRKYAIDICKALGVELIETLIGVELLPDMEGVFLSGTSIKILPVAAIDEHSFDSGTHPLIAGIRQQFDRLVLEYIEKNRDR